jgi:MFS family permease
MSSSSIEPCPGYANNIIGNGEYLAPSGKIYADRPNVVNTLLKRIYGPDFFPSNYSQTLTSIGFAGTVVGMLTFGYLSDKFGRKFGMVRKFPDRTFQ